ncbi:hypothetical protein ABGV42_01825 [Paenibacillus pabuli]
MKLFIKNNFGEGWEAVFYLTVFVGTPIGLALTVAEICSQFI